MAPHLDGSIIPIEPSITPHSVSRTCCRTRQPELGRQGRLVECALSRHERDDGGLDASDQADDGERWGVYVQSRSAHLDGAALVLSRYRVCGAGLSRDVSIGVGHLVASHSLVAEASVFEAGGGGDPRCGRGQDLAGSGDTGDAGPAGRGVVGSRMSDVVRPRSASRRRSTGPCGRRGWSQLPGSRGRSWSVERLG